LKRQLKSALKTIGKDHFSIHRDIELILAKVFESEKNSPEIRKELSKLLNVSIRNVKKFTHFCFHPEEIGENSQ